MSLGAIDAKFGLVVPSSGAAQASQDLDANEGSHTRESDINVNRGIPSLSVAKHKTRYADTLALDAMEQCLRTGKTHL